MDSNRIIEQIVTGDVKVRLFPESFEYILVDQLGNQIEVDQNTYNKVCIFIESGGVLWK